MRLPSLWGELKEIIGDAMLVAFGCILLFIFLTIEVFGRYGVENNIFIRWVEIFMGLPLIVLGVERFIHDVRRFNAMRRNKK
jgi:uncharacterized membrane protein YfhO|tara:strand:+ start:378 stop:623 length:246 start_codon:yes stop_codon:yes gene_type:complete